MPTSDRSLLSWSLLISLHLVLWCALGVFTGPIAIVSEFLLLGLVTASWHPLSKGLAWLLAGGLLVVVLNLLSFGVSLDMRLTMSVAAFGAAVAGLAILEVILGGVWFATGWTFRWRTPREEQEADERPAGQAAGLAPRRFHVWHLAVATAVVAGLCGAARVVLASVSQRAVSDALEVGVTFSFSTALVFVLSATILLDRWATAQTATSLAAIGVPLASLAQFALMKLAFGHGAHFTDLVLLNAWVGLILVVNLLLLRGAGLLFAGPAEEPPAMQVPTPNNRAEDPPGAGANVGAVGSGAE